MQRPAADAACDVIVVGAGSGGMAAAATAACKRLDVIVLEKAPVIGGTSAWSAGGTWIPVNALAARAGIADSRHAALEYFRHCAGRHFNPARVEAFLDRGPEMLAFFEEQAEMRFTVAHGRPDYHPDAPGASLEGRTIHPFPFDARGLGPEIARVRPPLREMTVMGMMIKPGPDLKHFLNALHSWKSFRFVARRFLRHFLDIAVHGRAMELSNGNALIARLFKTALDHGAKVYTSIGVKDLVWDGTRVAGVRYAASTGEGTIIARRGVVLATGGFSHDVRRRAALYRHAVTGTEHWSPATRTNTGDGLRMAEGVRGRIDANLAQPAGWAPVSLVPNGRGAPVVFAHLIDRQKPGFIAVTRRGKRFVNEANSYHDFGRGLLAACQGEEIAEAFLIADHRALRRYGMGAVKPAPFPLGRHLRSGYLLRGNTWRELAERSGIDVAALERTIVAFNEGAREGRDPEFGRGDNPYNRYNGDLLHAPNPNVAPIEVAPFYAVRIVIGELGTFAGLDTDSRARVLGDDGKSIAGLYAAGNDAASVGGGDYLGGGATIGPGMTWGYIAACDMAAAHVA